MKTCPYCEAEIANNAKKCKHCWETVVEEKEVRLCPYCESELSDTAKKCKFCGEWLDKKVEYKCNNCWYMIKKWDKTCSWCWSKLLREGIINSDRIHETKNKNNKENTLENLITWTNLNRIWRVKYIARNCLLLLLLTLCFSIFFYILHHFEGVADGIYMMFGIIFIGIFILYMYWQIILNNKRLHDYWYSWWMQLVPIWGLIVLYFMPWTVWKNQYGEASETKEREKVLAIMYLIFLFLGMIGAFD